MKPVLRQKKSRGYSNKVNSENRVPREQCLSKLALRRGKTQMQTVTREDGLGDNKMNCRREKLTETSKNYFKHHRNQTHSLSSSKEDMVPNTTPKVPSQKDVRKGKFHTMRGNPETRRIITLTSTTEKKRSLSGTKRPVI